MTYEEAWQSMMQWNEDMIEMLVEKWEYDGDRYALMSLDAHREFKKQMNQRIPPPNTGRRYVIRRG